MKCGPSHRGSGGDALAFAQHFVRARLWSLEKDMEICLSPMTLPGRKTPTHAYFPALAACCGTLEYLTGLHQGRLRGIGWRQIVPWAAAFMRQPDYDEEAIRVLFEVFRHPVAHRGIASGVWVDGRGAMERRLTWNVKADARFPGVDVRQEKGELTRDPPWPCPFTHRVHIHLGRLWRDLRDASDRYVDVLADDQGSLENFQCCMRQLYPR